MRTVSVRWPAGMALAVVIGSVITGCDPSPTSDRVIVVTPPSASLLSGVESSVVFTAAPAGSNDLLHLPLEWSVSDPALGVIKASGGVTAIYSSTLRPGNNAVMVRDQAGMEGIAAVSQVVSQNWSGAARRECSP